MSISQQNRLLQHNDKLSKSLQKSWCCCIVLNVTREKIKIGNKRIGKKNTQR